MKKLLFRTILLASVLLFPVPTMAEVNIGISIPLPPLIVFSAPPEVVVIPETYVYVVPDSDVTSFSTMVGGGVRGKGAGIAHGAITQVGSTIKGSHPFMEGYRRVGGTTTGNVAGEDIHGTISGFLNSNFNGTGAPGKRAIIGRSSKPGVSKG